MWTSRCGSGRTTRALLAAGPRLVHAVDVGATLDDDLLLDPRVRAHIAGLEDLPLPDGERDVAVSLNAVEHLADVGGAPGRGPPRAAPRRHGRARPLRLGHRAVHQRRRRPDPRAARPLRRPRPGAGPEATVSPGRKLLRHAARSPFAVESVHSWADPHRRFDEGSVAWKVATGILAAAGDDPALDRPRGGLGRGPAPRRPGRGVPLHRDRRRRGAAQARVAEPARQAPPLADQRRPTDAGGRRGRVDQQGEGVPVVPRGQAAEPAGAARRQGPATRRKLADAVSRLRGKGWGGRRRAR